MSDDLEARWHHAITYEGETYIKFADASVTFSLYRKDIAAKDARIAELEGALKPFSDLGEFIVKHFPDPETDQNHETATLVRHFRNAHNTLAGGKDEA